MRIPWVVLVGMACDHNGAAWPCPDPLCLTSDLIDFPAVFAADFVILCGARVALFTFGESQSPFGALFGTVTGKLYSLVEQKIEFFFARN